MQFSYDYPNGLPGQIGTYASDDVASIANPLLAQITNVDMDGGTANGVYTVQAVGADGSSASASFTASSNTAAQIAAGLVAAILADPEFAGLVSAAAVVNTDQLNITFQREGVDFVVSMASDPSAGIIITTSQAAGSADIEPGVILQANGSGGFTTTYSDASLALGVVIRNADLCQPLSNNALAGFDGPSMMSLLRRGEVYVRVAAGVSVSRGNKAYFNSTAKTWSNSTGGSHVLVEGAQWQESGSGVRRVFVNLPSET